MTSHLVSLHPSNRETTPEKNSNIIPISLTSKLVASGPQIVLYLSLCEPKTIQKPFAKI